MDSTRLRPYSFLLRRGAGTALAFFVPAFGVLYFLTIPHGPWVAVLISQIVVTLVSGYAVLAYIRLGIWVGPHAVTERSLVGCTKTIAVSSIGSIVMVNTFRGGWTETVPQLFVCDSDGKQIMRMRGQFWSREAMAVVANTLPVKVTELTEPVSTAELHAAYPGLLYWFERRPLLAAILFALTLLTGAAVLYFILTALGETVGRAA